MRSKAPLVLMEQMVMILVFALAAALCLQAFVKSDEMSRQSETRDRAVTLCQNAAETLRLNGGDFPKTLRQITGISPGPSAAVENELLAMFDADWDQPITTEAVYQLRARRVDSGIPGLGKAEVYVEPIAPSAEEVTRIFQIEVAWQEEVAVHG